MSRESIFYTDSLPHAKAVQSGLLPVLTDAQRTSEASADTRHGKMRESKSSKQESPTWTAD